MTPREEMHQYIQTKTQEVESHYTKNTWLCLACQAPVHADGRFDPYCHTCTRSMKMRGGMFKKNYGITFEEYRVMFNQQCGACASCRKPAVLHRAKKSRELVLVVDHDHITGRVRGLLCNNCNMALGLMGDNSEGVRRMLHYIERTDSIK